MYIEGRLGEVVVREAVVEDAGALLEYVRELGGEGDIHIPMGPEGLGVSLEEEEVFLRGCALAENSIFLVACDEGGEIVGSLDIQGMRRVQLRHAGRLGMSVRRGWRGRGVGTMLLEEGLRWAREGGVLCRVELEVYAENVGAIALYERFGFELEGVRRKAIYQWGRWIDDHLMALVW